MSSSSFLLVLWMTHLAIDLLAHGIVNGTEVWASFSTCHSIHFRSSLASSSFYWDRRCFPQAKTCAPLALSTSRKLGLRQNEQTCTFIAYRLPMISSLNRTRPYSIPLGMCNESTFVNEYTEQDPPKMNARKGSATDKQHKIFTLNWLTEFIKQRFA